MVSWSISIRNDALTPLTLQPTTVYFPMGRPQLAGGTKIVAARVPLARQVELSDGTRIYDEYNNRVIVMDTQRHHHTCCPLLLCIHYRYMHPTPGLKLLHNSIRSLGTHTPILASLSNSLNYPALCMRVCLHGNGGTCIHCVLCVVLRTEKTCFN